MTFLAVVSVRARNLLETIFGLVDEITQLAGPESTSAIHAMPGPAALFSTLLGTNVQAWNINGPHNAYMRIDAVNGESGWKKFGLAVT